MFHPEAAAEKQLSMESILPPSPAQLDEAKQAFGGNKMTSLQSRCTGNFLSTRRVLLGPCPEIRAQKQVLSLGRAPREMWRVAGGRCRGMSPGRQGRGGGAWSRGPSSKVSTSDRQRRKKKALALVLVGQETVTQQ